MNKTKIKNHWNLSGAENMHRWKSVLNPHLQPYLRIHSRWLAYLSVDLKILDHTMKNIFMTEAEVSLGES